jgi:hypothetical protein
MRHKKSIFPVFFLLLHLGLCRSAYSEDFYSFGVHLGEESNHDKLCVQNICAENIHGHVWWAKFEPSDDEYDFDYYEEEIERFYNSGITINYVFKTGQFWATGDPDTIPYYQQRPSHVPVDLSATWDPVYGYSESYYDFIHSFVTFSNTPVKRVKFLIIEDEPETEYWFAGTARQYTGLLKTAYKAAKDADPDILVLNGGPSSMSMGIILPREMIELNEKYNLYTEDYILKTTNRYWRRYRFSPSFSSYEQLEQYVTNDAKWRSYTFVTTLLDNLVIDELPDKPLTVDAVNFHFTEDYIFIDSIVDFFQYHMYIRNDYPEIPLCSDHLGIRIPRIEGDIMDPTYERSILCAYDQFKYMIDARYRRLILIAHYRMLRGQKYFWDKCALGHVDEEGDERPYHSAGAFKTVASILTDMYEPSWDEPRKMNNVKFYRFSRKKNPATAPVLAAWTDAEDPVTITVKIPGSFDTIRRMDYRGQTIDIDIPPDRHIEHTFTEEPFFYFLLDG